MKKSNYVLYRATKQLAVIQEEFYDSYLESFEFAIELGQGLVDGSIHWDSLSVEDQTLWLEALAIVKDEPLCSSCIAKTVRAETGVGYLPLIEEPVDEVPLQALYRKGPQGLTVLYPDFPNGWFDLLELELLSDSVPEWTRGQVAEACFEQKTHKRLGVNCLPEAGDDVVAKDTTLEGEVAFIVKL